MASVIGKERREGKRGRKWVWGPPVREREEEKLVGSAEMEREKNKTKWRGKEKGEERDN